MYTLYQLRLKELNLHDRNNHCNNDDDSILKSNTFAFSFFGQAVYYRLFSILRFIYSKLKKLGKIIFFLKSFVNLNVCKGLCEIGGHWMNPSK